MQITYFKRITQTTEGKHIDLERFIEAVAGGTWQDQILAVRTGNMDKAQLPYVTISGTFQQRNSSGLIKHSGLICIDIDQKDNPDFHASDFKLRIKDDPYILCAFLSASGKGLACIIPISPNKHQESFAGLQEYFFREYQIVIDQACRDVCRPRFISWDMELYHNPKAQTWKKYPPRAEKKLPPGAIFVQEDFNAILQQIQVKQVDITGSYHDWLRIGFSLVEKFGETGRNHFHIVSQYSPSYTYDLTDRQYTACTRATGSGVTWGTFIYYCKQAGIETMSLQTKKIAQAAGFAMKSKVDPSAALAKISKKQSIAIDIIQPILDQVYTNNIMVGETSEIELIESWLEAHYDLKYNEFTDEIELAGERITDRRIRDIWRAGKRIFDDLGYDDTKRVIFSGFAPSFNPFHDFFNANAAITCDPQYISDFISCIETDTGFLAGEFFPEYADLFIKKWLISIIASIHGEHSPLMLVLTGPQNTGKTEWFRRLLPPQLQRYMVQSKMDRGKDDEILMAKNILIFDDEMSGKSKKEEKMMKEFLSSQRLTLRKPYDSIDVTLHRHAVFCGTTNELEVLNDPTGNRRIIPINVLSIDQPRLNSFDRVKLFMGLYYTWQQGFQWQLTREDIINLNNNTALFKCRSAETEFIVKFYRLPINDESGVWISSAEIWAYLESRGSKLSYRQCCRSLSDLGWKSVQKKFNGQNLRRYNLVQL